MSNIVDNLSKQMRYKLSKNHDKYCPVMNPDGRGRDYSNCSTEWLIKRLKEEVKELEGAINEGDIENAKRECGDVANFAAFILDILDRD
ncbi:hypothetical protein KAR91_56035 [Candidatus Pacearchaeota archaeon]|nr:hypothetical protein [Candidatus Pacearchaeota archaeon]